MNITQKTTIPKLLSLMTLLIAATLIFSVSLSPTSSADEPRWKKNQDRIDRLKKGCNPPGNAGKCQDLQKDLIISVGSSCVDVYYSFTGGARGTNKGNIAKCQKGIDALKTEAEAPTDSSPAATGGDSPSAGGSTPAADTGTSPGAGDETKITKWQGGKVGVDKINAEPIAVTEADAKKSGLVKVEEKSFLNGLLNAVYTLTAIAAVIVITAAGIMITLSDGDANKVATGRRAIIYASVGLVIVGTAFIITGIIQSIGTR